ncbi:MAG TPA: ABC transporter ATP-binding protein [Streptosporangiaceae bacterium]|jgi:multiple sugar transport system ATP-binding protein
MTTAASQTTQPEAAAAAPVDARALRVKHLSRRYGQVQALSDLTLDIPAGAFVTLLGPSGCGKSTTLSLIAGLDKPTAGQVYLGDREITKMPPNERRMAMVFQNFALYPHMTAAENIGFGLKLQHRPRDEIRSRVAAVAEMLDIGHLLGRKPGEMSGGQQQRVALGRALVKEPLAFLLDEPFSNLDAGLRTRMRTEVKHLHLRLETTSIFVTHDQEEALTLSDLLAVMRAGELVQFGTTDDIYRRPRDMYVASFVGKPKMSLIEGMLEAGDGPVFTAPGVRIELPPRSVPGDPPGRVTAGLRAEDVTLVGAGEAEPGTSFEATVELLEPIGSDTFVELAAATSRLVARVAPDVRPAIGERVTVRVRPDRVHLFDTGSQLRISA